MSYYEDDDRDERPRRRRERPDDPRRDESDESREQALRRRLRQRVEQVDDDDDEPVGPYPRIPNYPPPYRSAGGGCAMATLYAVLGVLAIIVLLIVLAPRIIGSTLGGVLSGLPQGVAQAVASPTPTVRDRGGTIQQIRSLNRLETQIFSIERVVEASVQRNNPLDLFLGEKLLLIASGNVIAGVDLSKIKPSDIVVSEDGESITLNLPPSEIFLATLDNTRTKVYDKQTGIGTRLLGGENRDLETQARQKAEGEILQAACEGGVMQRAADEARRSLEQLLRAMDFSRVSVNAPAGQCVAPASANTAPTPTP